MKRCVQHISEQLRITFLEYPNQFGVFKGTHHTAVFFKDIYQCLTSQIHLISCLVKFCHLTHPLKGQGYGLNKQVDMELFPYIRDNFAEIKQQILQILYILKIKHFIQFHLVHMHCFL